MATLQHTALVSSLIQQLAASAAAVVTNPSGSTTYIKGWRLFNTHTSLETVDIYVVLNSGGSVGTAASANKTFHYALQPNEWIQEDFPANGIVLPNQNDTIQASATDASKVNLIIFGDIAT